MLKVAYPHPEDDARINELMALNAALDKKKEEVVKELRELIYKAERR
jgi:hypothetical protein